MIKKIIVAAVFLSFFTSHSYALDSKLGLRIDSVMNVFEQKMQDKYVDFDDRLQASRILEKRIQNKKEDYSGNLEIIELLDYIETKAITLSDEYSKHSGWSELTSNNFWNNKEYFGSIQNNPNIIFSHPTGWDRAVGLDTDGFSKNMFLDPSGDSILSVTEYFIGNCRIVFAFCEEDDFVERTIQERLEILRTVFDTDRYKDMPIYPFETSYYIESLDKTVYSNLDENNFLFELNGDLLEITINAVDENGDIDRDLINEILSRLKK